MRKQLAWVRLVIGGMMLLIAGQLSAAPVGKDLYLRGNMNNWKAPAEFKLAAVEGKTDTWAVQADLKKGKKYEFKLADKSWNCGTNFGRHSRNDKVELDKPIKLNKCASYDNLDFKPAADGTYIFTLDWSGEDPMLLLQLAE